MLFQYTYEAVINGQKQQTRRLIRADDVAQHGHDNQIIAVLQNGRKKWSVGSVYAVQPGRGKRAVASIRVLAISSQTVRDISTDDARAEGFADRQAFFDIWRQIHGDDALDRRVWVLKFELVSVRADAAVVEQQHSELDDKGDATSPL